MIDKIEYQTSEYSFQVSICASYCLYVNMPGNADISP